MTTTKNIAELARELGRATGEMRMYLRQYLDMQIRLEEVDITFELLEILAYLYRKDGVNQQELADITAKDKSSMTYLIDSLVKREMVTRKEDPQDRRSKLIYLTVKGKRLEKKLGPWIVEIYEKATEGLTTAEVQQALLIVQKMNDNLRK
ncbi:MarR family winged helix-turn-helix transcriptional regulator [Chitinophaga arvensicola]|uniref:DNA-binding transcriptional regulator, MarR family n=1 Tax=Chitinophaga arvensicola TaxID=29529 RepID=A0A1I0S7J1_9BACT|nr:MarR family transcriptional regulator [Chitinophaga arvensicola]SEW51733.1 DNA-binding transcriptional regulator, MarR family [Chitinophaga arvensicola]